MSVLIDDEKDEATAAAAVAAMVMELSLGFGVGYVVEKVVVVVFSVKRRSCRASE